MSLLLVNGIVYAHSGGTDANGGHFNRKTGEYHSHDSGGIEFFIVLIGLVFIYIIWKLLIESNGQRQVPTPHRSSRSHPTTYPLQQPSLSHVNTSDRYSTIPPPSAHRRHQPFDYQAEWWRELSEEYRNDKDWTCEECQLCLDADHQYLHVHHIRGTQYNDPEDLKALCIACHSEQPGSHQRLKQSPDYPEFMRKYGREWSLLTRKKDDSQRADNITSPPPFYPQQSEKTEIPDAAEKYEFKGKPLTPNIVETIFLRWSKCRDSDYLTIRQWSEYVTIYHEERGGLSTQGKLANIVGAALISLQRQSLARQKYSTESPSGVWKIL